ncbi:hypothetical protein J437_LFUL019393 [Ladona fulva]|uniref:Uncharacterized protein n=1 Tax=Ladona fulva TaxID=123851 RepID=A0A8K0KR53_LADFU|nr:hypothetical protein J437_LFUL019393 [Ladona fulva]
MKHQAQLAGLSTGLKIPRGRGPRFVILHAGSARGFVEGAKMVYLANKGQGTTMMRWKADGLKNGSNPSCYQILARVL